MSHQGQPRQLSSLDAAGDRLAELVAAGIVRPPAHLGRHLPKRRIKSRGAVSDLVAEQRR